MRYFSSKYNELPGTSLPEVTRHARYEYRVIQKRSPRRIAYVRSKYFRQKVFINTFWAHLDAKNNQDCMRRLKLFNCAVDLLSNSVVKPEAVQDLRRAGIALYRFYGKSASGQCFCVQVKENSRTGERYFISVFPAKPK